jgi:hypothetical protein
LLGVHSRYGLHTRAVTVFRDTLSEGFSHFVTSMTAPVASGWSVRRVGFAPTGKRRLVTAHGQSGRPVARSKRRFADLGAKLRLFAIYTSRNFVDDGGLMSYGTDCRLQYRCAAELVDKILKRREAGGYSSRAAHAARYVDSILHGAKPSELPVQMPIKYLMIINLKTAKALGLIVPPSILLGADEVIE